MLIMVAGLGRYDWATMTIAILHTQLPYRWLLLKYILHHVVRSDEMIQHVFRHAAARPNCCAEHPYSANTSAVKFG